MREHLITNIRKIAIEIINRIFKLKSKKNSLYKWGRSRDSNPSPGIHSPGG